MTDATTLAATEAGPDASSAAGELSPVVVNLLKGPIYRDTHEKLWDVLLNLHGQVADYVAVLGLVVQVDESEGYAFLRSRPVPDEGDNLPRLVARRSLPFHVSLLLALLRKRLAEFDASSSETRLTLTRGEIVEMIRLYLPDTTNEARTVDTIAAHVNRLVDYGFLRRMHGNDELFEVRRIIKALVDGQWLSEFDARLEDYLRSLEDGTSDDNGDPAGE